MIRTETINLTPYEVRQVLDERDALRKECQRLKEELEKRQPVYSVGDWRQTNKEGGSIK